MATLRTGEREACLYDQGITPEVFVQVTKKALQDRGRSRADIKKLEDPVYLCYFLNSRISS